MTNNSLEQAKAQLAGVRQLVQNLNEAYAGDDEMMDEARQLIHEDPLSIEVRTKWADPSGFQHPDIDVEADQYRIVLCTGGPAVQIVGSLNKHNEPSSAIIHYSDWFHGWEEYVLSEEEEEDVLEYARCFYFGA
jgi:hypothetical protein